MTKGPWLRVAIGAAAATTLVAVACGGDDDDGALNRASDAGVADVVSADADAAVPCPLPVSARTTIRGLVKILDGSKSPPPASGARVCVHGRADLPCASALADGTYEHECVPVGDVAILFSHEGTGRTLWLRVLTAGLPQLVDAPIATRSENTKLFAAANVTYPRPGTGIITLNDSFDSAKGGITITPPSGVDGPFYSTDGEGITHDGGSTEGLGFAFMVAPVGDVRIELSGTDGGACGQLSGGWGSRDGGLTVPVLEDTETLAFIACP